MLSFGLTARTQSRNTRHRTGKRTLRRHVGKCERGLSESEDGVGVLEFLSPDLE